MTLRLPRTWIILLLSVLVVAAGCARSPEAKKAKHLERGDKYFSKAQYREALIEYANVLQIDGTNTRAIRQVALAHYQLGEIGQAFPYLVKSQQLDPENPEVRLKLGSIYLLSRQPAEARQQVAVILGKDPKNFEALLLWAGAAITPQEVDAAIQRLEEARADYGDKARLHIALAALYVRKQEVAKAERALQEAVAKEPKSLEAHTTLGDFYIANRDIAQAEREYRTAAELAPVGSPARLKLADFYLSFQKPEEGKRILAEIIEKAPGFLTAWRRLAEVALAERKYDECLKALDVVFKKSPSDLDGLLLRGRVHLAKGEATAAIEDFQKVVKLEPRSAQARFQLAQAHLQTGNLQQAKVELKEATTVDPNFVEATLLLAELNIQTAAFQPAIQELEKLLAKQPKTIRAYQLLGTAYLAKIEPAKATEAYREIVALAPKDPRGPYLVGIGLGAQGKRGEAKKEFEASLALAPDFLEPLANLAWLALGEKAPDAALERVKRQIARVPDSGSLQDLLGRIYALRGEVALAEAAFLKALELEPNLVRTYLAIGQLYADSRKYDQSLAKLNAALRMNPKNLVALLLSGVVYERRGEISRAQEAYDKALAIDSRSAPAANNLAYLHSQHGGDKDKALHLAQMAREADPEEPSIADTLGWILYKRGVYQRALSLFKESASKLPGSPEIQYHLGMGYLKVGDKDAARKALTLAVNSPTSFIGKEEAQKELAALD